MGLEVKKPTAYTTDSGTAFSNPGQAYDTDTAGDETTRADAFNSVEGSTGRWHTWADKVETYGATDLKVKWMTSGGFSNDLFAIEATKDGGSNWNLTLLAMGLHNDVVIQTASVALDANQDLTQVEVRVVVGVGGQPDADYIYIYDIWTEGTYTEVSRRIFITS